MKQGFKYIPNFLDSNELEKLTSLLRNFHYAWLEKNAEAFRKGAINSAYITSGEFLTSNERLDLIKFVSSKKIVAEAREILGDDIRFMNTQLFFNPLNNSQKNYWHRDIQYTGQSEESQRKTIEEKNSQVIHLRLALSDEEGIEFVPASHFRWDTDEELDTRFGRKGKNIFDDIIDAKKQPLTKGDLLIFDANIIHRGLYGKERFAFDILFFRPLPELMRFQETIVLPQKNELPFLECPEIF